MTDEVEQDQIDGVAELKTMLQKHIGARQEADLRYRRELLYSEINEEIARKWSIAARQFKQERDEEREQHEHWRGRAERAEAVLSQIFEALGGVAVIKMLPPWLLDVEAGDGQEV